MPSFADWLCRGKNYQQYIFLYLKLSLWSDLTLKKIKNESLLQQKVCMQRKKNEIAEFFKGKAENSKN